MGPETQCESEKGKTFMTRHKNVDVFLFTRCMVTMDSNVHLAGISLVQATTNYAEEDFE